MNISSLLTRFGLGKVVRKLSKAPVQLGNCALTETELLTGTLVFGEVGRGKASRVLKPMLHQLIEHYNSANSGGKHKDVGGLVIDANEGMLGQVMQSLHEAGRLPNSNLSVLTTTPHSYREFKDPQTGFTWLVDTEQSNRWILGQDLVFCEGSVYSVNTEVVDYLGWTCERSKLVRSKPAEAAFLHTGPKERNEAEYPVSLVAVREVTLPLSVSFNLCPEGFDATQLSDYLLNLLDTTPSELHYYTGALRRHLFNVISLLKHVNPNTILTLWEITFAITNADHMELELEAARDIVEDNGNDLSRRVALEAVLLYFDHEWFPLSSRDRSSVNGLWTENFGAFSTEDRLTSAYCSPTTFDLRLLQEAGKWLVLIPPKEHALEGRIIVRALISQYYHMLLMNLQRGLERKVILLVDDVHGCMPINKTEAVNPILSGRVTGSNCITLLGTTDEAAIYNAVGKDAGNLFLDARGIKVRFTDASGNCVIDVTRPDPYKVRDNLNALETDYAIEGALTCAYSKQITERLTAVDFTVKIQAAEQTFLRVKQLQETTEDFI